MSESFRHEYRTRCPSRAKDRAVGTTRGAAFVCELLDIGDQPVVLEEFAVTSDYGMFGVRKQLRCGVPDKITDAELRVRS